LAGLDEPTTKALQAAIAHLQAAGAQIVEVSVPDVRPFLERAIASALVEAAISHRATYPSQKASYSKTYIELLETGRATSVLDYAAIAIWRREFHGRLMQMFNEVDLLVAPVVPIEPPSMKDFAATLDAPPLGAAPLLAYTIPFNLAGVPSLTLPMGQAPSGAPLGFQLIGPDLEEASLLSAGAAYERAAGFEAHHPDI
jgi:amidase